MNSSDIVKTITNMAINGLCSVMGANKRSKSQFYIKEMNVCEMWKEKVNSESDKVRMSVHIRELCEWIDKCDCTFLIKDYHQTTMNDLCTS